MRNCAYSLRRRRRRQRSISEGQILRARSPVPPLFLSYFLFHSPTLPILIHPFCVTYSTVDTGRFSPRTKLFLFFSPPLHSSFLSLLHIYFHVLQLYKSRPLKDVASHIYLWQQKRHNSGHNNHVFFFSGVFYRRSMDRRMSLILSSYYRLVSVVRSRVL